MNHHALLLGHLGQHLVGGLEHQGAVRLRGRDDGVRVVELGTLIAGPFRTRILAALGYDAVRIAGLRAAGAI